MAKVKSLRTALWKVYREISSDWSLRGLQKGHPWKTSENGEIVRLF